MNLQLRGNVITMLSMVTWATTFPVTDILLETWHPLLVTLARLLLAVPLLFLMLWAAGRWHEVRGAPWGAAFLVGGIGLSGAALFVVLGVAFSDPVTVAIIAATVPLISALIGVAARTERLTPPIAAGIALAVAGAVVTVWRGDGEGMGFRGGEFFVVLANICFIWYSRGCLTRLADLSDIGKAALTAGCSAAVVLAATVIGLAAGLVPAAFNLSASSLVLVIWMAMVANGVSIVLWLKGAQLLRVTIASMHQNLVPLYVVLMVLPLGGTVTWQQIVGGALVISGAVLAQLPAARRGHRPSV